MTVIVTASLMMPSTGGTVATESFRSFVKVIGDSFAQAGWIDTNAVGALNTGSITPPPGALARSMGYQVFQMNDTLHNTGYPVFTRIDYGNASSTANLTSIAFTVGFTHDGSGSVGGVALGYNNTGNSAMYTSIGAVAVSGTLYDHRICVISGGDMGIILANNFATNATFGFVERTKDVFGNPSTDGIIVGQWDDAAPAYRQSYLMYNQSSSGQAPSPETFQNYVHSGQATSVADNFLSVGLFIPMVSYGPHNPLRMMGFTKASDLPTNATHTLEVYNTASTYFVSANTAFESYLLSTNNNITTNTRLMMRSE
jgi:hypothetical protein